MNGIVTGGWGFVWGAYLVSAIVLGAYAVRTIFVCRSGIEERQHKGR
jgi:hypothetical protein